MQTSQTQKTNSARPGDTVVIRLSDNSSVVHQPGFNLEMIRHEGGVLALEEGAVSADHELFPNFHVVVLIHDCVWSLNFVITWGLPHNLPAWISLISSPWGTLTNGLSLSLFCTPFGG